MHLSVPITRRDSAESGNEAAFDGRYLVFDMRKQCGARLRIGSWEQGLELFHEDPVTGEWLLDDIDPGFTFGVDPKYRDDPVQRFLATIPADLFAVLGQFHWRQVVLLRAVRYDRRSLDLVQSNPTLAWLAADYAAEQGMTPAQCAALLNSRRRAICAAAGGPETDGAVRIIGRIMYHEYNHEKLWMLRQLVRSHGMLESLRNCRYIPGDFLRQILTAEGFTQSAIMRNEPHAVAQLFTSCDTAYDLLQLWKDALRVAAAIDIPDRLRRLQACRTSEELTRRHDEWTRLMNEAQVDERAETFMKRYGTATFPRPPIEGTEDIVPITTAHMLAAEGSAMEHCVASYCDNVMAGVCYIYRVLKPERATLEIVLSRDRLTIGQFKLRRNHDPSKETADHVRAWLADATTKKKTEAVKTTGEDERCAGDDEIPAMEAHA